MTRVLKGEERTHHIQGKKLCGNGSRDCSSAARRQRMQGLLETMRSQERNVEQILSPYLQRKLILPTP